MASSTETAKQVSKSRISKLYDGIADRVEDSTHPNGEYRYDKKLIDLITPIVVPMGLDMNPRHFTVFRYWVVCLRETFEDHRYANFSDEYNVNCARMHMVAQCLIMLDINHSSICRLATSYLTSDISAYGQAVYGSLQALDDEFSEAIRLYKGSSATDSVYNEVRYKPGMVPGLPAFFYALSVIKTNTPIKSFEILHKHSLEYAKTHPDDRFFDVVKILADYAAARLRITDIKSLQWIKRGNINKCPWAVITACVCFYWLGKKPPRHLTNSLSKYCKSAETAYIEWYQKEATELLSIDHDLDHHNNLQLGINSKSGWLMGLVDQPIKLEDQLEQLRNVSELASGSEDVEEPETRLLWGCLVDDQKIYVKAYLQSMTKRGKWGKERIYHLFAYPKNFKSITTDDTDKSLFNALYDDYLENIRVNSHHYSHSPTEQNIYKSDGYVEISSAEQLTLLSGVSNLVPSKPNRSTGEAMQISIEKPQLLCKNNDNTGEVHVKTEPSHWFGSNRSYSARWYIQSVSECHLVATIFDEQQLEVNRLLGPDGMWIPAKRFKELSETLLGITPLL